MKPNPSFQNQPSDFWALVKYASEALGYSNRSRKNSDNDLRRYTIPEIQGLTDHFEISANIEGVVDYLNYRANLIENDVQSLLMDREKAQMTFEDIRSSYTPTCYLPMNKQKGEKRHYSYFTCIVNMLTEKNLVGRNFDDNPGRLCLITDTSNKLVKTLCHAESMAHILVY